jgi:hypothetical protein
MNLPERVCKIALVASLSLATVVLLAGPVIAGDHGPSCSHCVSATRSETVCAVPTTVTLGTFEPTPYIMVRGNWPLGGGYSPLDIYGDQSLAIYGPLSPLRATTAPVRTYSRGYDGRIHAREGTSFSNPNLPRLSPFVYPTPANYYYGPRVNRTPPWWSSGFNWIDQQ